MLLKDVGFSDFIRIFAMLVRTYYLIYLSLFRLLVEEEDFWRQTGF